MFDMPVCARCRCVWSAEYVDAALLAGTLTKADVVRHVHTAPAAVVPPSWLAAQGLAGPLADVTARHSVVGLSSLYRCAAVGARCAGACGCLCAGGCVVNGCTGECECLLVCA